MTTRYYLNEHSLKAGDLARFKSSLKSFGATLVATDAPDRGLVRVIAAAGEEFVQVTMPDERADSVEHASCHFGFKVSKEPPPVPNVGPARMDLIL